MISEFVYIEMNQEEPIYRKTLGALCSRLRHRLHQRIVNLLMVHSKGRQPHVFHNRPNFSLVSLGFLGNKHPK